MLVAVKDYIYICMACHLVCDWVMFCLALLCSPRTVATLWCNDAVCFHLNFPYVIYLSVASDDHFLFFIRVFISFLVVVFFLFVHIALSTYTSGNRKKRDRVNEKILNREYASERRGSFFSLLRLYSFHSILWNGFKFEMRIVYLLLVCFINKTFTTKRLNLSLRECGKDTIFPMKIATTRFRLNAIALLTNTHIHTNERNTFNH